MRHLTIYFYARGMVGPHLAPMSGQSQVLFPEGYLHPKDIQSYVDDIVQLPGSWSVVIHTYRDEILTALMVNIAEYECTDIYIDLWLITEVILTRGTTRIHKMEYLPCPTKPFCDSKQNRLER